jgi:hypothetical protein
VLVDTPLSVGWDNNNDVANLDEFTGLRNENNDPGFGMLRETTRRIKPLERRLDRLNKTNRIYVAINALLPLGENFRSDNLVNILSFAQCNQDLLDEGTLTTRDADAYQQAIARGGSVCLNRFQGFLKWFSALVTPLPHLAAAD